MFRIITALLLMTFQVSVTDQPQMRGWKGILPLHSTRTDVEKLLGKSSDTCNCRYGGANEAVVIHYAKGPCKGPPHGWKVPAGTVLDIKLYPKSQLLIAQLGLNTTEYNRSLSVGEFVVFFTNVEEGIQYTVNDEKVASVSYIPSRRDFSLRCEGFPEYDGRVREYHPYAAFSTRAQFIEQRLDEFGLQLANHERLQGYIITYAGRVAKSGEGKRMGEEAKRGLIKSLNLPGDRIITIDGGFREEAEFELHLVPKGMAAPSPTPTLTPSEVTVTRERSPRLRRSPRRRP